MTIPGLFAHETDSLLYKTSTQSFGPLLMVCSVLADVENQRVMALLVTCVILNLQSACLQCVALENPAIHTVALIHLDVLAAMSLSRYAGTDEDSGSISVDVITTYRILSFSWILSSLF